MVAGGATPPWREPRRGHVPPEPGYPQPQRPVGGWTGQAGGGAGFVTVGNRLFAPLQGLDPDNVLEGGYGWLSGTDYVGGVPKTLHPGLDLNAGTGCSADAGNLVVAPLAGIVRATLDWDGYTPGEGNHVWVELDDPCCPGPTWWHTDHLQYISVVVGQRLVPGQPIGGCGKSGGWDCEHAHTELLKGAPEYGWWQWPYGWSRAAVEAAYWNPSEWWQIASAKVVAEQEDVQQMALMTDWQIKNWVLADLYQWAELPYSPESGTAQGWVDALRDGHYLGRPRTEERPYGEGDGAGVWVEFDYGVLFYRLSDGAKSWEG